MSQQQIAADNKVKTWASKAYIEFQRGNYFKRLMGSSTSAVIHVERDKEGDDVGGVERSRPLVYQAGDAPVMDDNTLMGNESTVGNYAHTVVVRQYRTAFDLRKYERRKSNFDMLEVLRELGTQWFNALSRDLVIARIGSLTTDGYSTYDSLTAAQLNAWSVAQNPATSNQRALYGAAASNWSGVHATDLANIDGTNDDLHQNIARLARRMAQHVDPAIRPATIGKGGNAGDDVFYAPVGSLAFRDLEANMDTIFQYADVRGDANHIFDNGEISVGKVKFWECPEMDRTTANGGLLLQDVGAGGTVDVQIAAVMGAQAMLMDIAETMHPIDHIDDYKNMKGVGVASMFGLHRSVFNGFDHSMVTMFLSAEPD